MPQDLDRSASALPSEFVERIREIIPRASVDGVLDAFTHPPSVGFRVNSLLSTREDAVSALRSEGLEPEPVPWWDMAFFLPAADRNRLLESRAYRESLVYVQNLSSMIPPLVLAPQPGERVLDLAAAPGSKTLQLAALMKQEGELAAVERVRSRFFKLQHNLARQGATGVRTFLQDGERVWRYRPEYFDRVLLDAPCSSEGRFREDEPESFRYWSLRKIREMVRKQRRLLFSAVNALKAGGRLVYSTCALSPEENEGAVASLLDRFGAALVIEPIDLQLENRMNGLTSWRGQDFPSSLARSVRILPSTDFEGFYVCSIHKRSSTVRARR